MIKIWNKDIECCSDRKKIEDIQLERLRHMACKAYENVPFYKKRLDESGIKPEMIKSLSDLRNLPFTTKEDLRDNYPFGLFAEPMKNVVRLHASSGTTGKPVVAGYTKGEGYRGQNSGAAKAGKGACRHRGSRRLYITASA